MLCAFVCVYYLSGAGHGVLPDPGSPYCKIACVCCNGVSCLLVVSSWNCHACTSQLGHSQLGCIHVPLVTCCRWLCVHPPSFTPRAIAVVGRGAYALCG